jgi:acyl transferase domain-containing protein
MSNETPDTTLLRRAFLKIEELEHLLKDKSRNEPIAVVGIGCKFPGSINDPESFWKLLTNGTDAICPVPVDRLKIKDFQRSLKDPDTSGIYVDCGGFLSEDVSGFDAQFFGISEREAKALDPQQRLVLETAWEALEHAGQNPDELAGTETGVFLGLSSNDYEKLIGNQRNTSEFNLYYLTGNAFSTASGRLSYFLGLNGPGLTIDTACSSSLTAVHYACQSIWHGECTTALAGGVNLVLSFEDLHSYCSASMISPSGRCKSFDSSADGFILSEGCGIVVLKRLSDALEHNDTIYSVIRGSSVNQDGASNGLTAPNSLAQAILIRQALKKAHLQPSDIHYIEAHGSGTPLGDPIEVQALASVFGRREAGNPLHIGCVKSNIGHCAAAAGIAGLIKTILSVYHGKIPQNLHFSNPNPLMPWDQITARIPSDNLDWPSENGIRRAGVSSFGVSGTNAHVILESAPSGEVSGPSRVWQMLPLSAKTKTALNVMAEKLASWIELNPSTPLADIAFTLKTGRKHAPFRSFIVCKNSSDFRNTLNLTYQTNVNPQPFSGQPSKIIFVFPGQGTQYPGMGSSIYKSESVFKDVFDRCADAFKKYIDEDLRSIVFENMTECNKDKLKNTLYAQPAIFSLEYALACLWLSWGVRPAALVGHSIGEFAAACLSGIMSFDDAVFLVARRSHLLNTLSPGTMISVRSSEEAVFPMMSPELSIAAINSPKLCVISGPSEAVNAFQLRCNAVNIPHQPLHTSHAFHSAMVEPVLHLFQEEANAISFSKPGIPIISTVTGTSLSDDDARDPLYWTRHMRLTVRFSEAVRKVMYQFPEGIFLEVGPRSTCTSLIQQHFHGQIHNTAVSSMSSNGEPDADLQQLITATGHLWMHGVPPDSTSFYKNEKRIRISLPSYPFERKSYWFNKTGSQHQVYCSQYREEPVSVPVTPCEKHTTDDVLCTNNKTAEKIRDLAATALGCSAESIADTTSFLHLGMDSLLLRQFSKQLNNTFGTEISFRHLMREYSTIHSLSAFIDTDDKRM